MGQDGDESISLPDPPPPRPAARRAAIDAALRKFDGHEDAPASRAGDRRAGPIRWATLHRRPAGALAAAAAIAIIGIPAIQIALRDQPSPAIEEAAPPEYAAPALEPVVGSPSAPRAAPPEQEDSVADEIALPAGRTPDPLFRKEADSLGFAESREEKAKQAAPAPAMIAPASPSIMSAPPASAPAPPPPPPPPPPPAEPQAEAAASSSDRIVVTGSRVRRSNLDAATPVTTVDPDGEFLSRLQQALEADDRRAVLRLVAFPLAVNFDGGRRTYRSSRDVERDFDRIFTPAVRRSALAMRPDTLQRRDGGRLRGTERIWFGCAASSCATDASIRIREVSP